MTLVELVEQAVTNPLSLITSKMFYVVSFNRSEIRLQGDFSSYNVRQLPKHLRDDAELDGSGHLCMSAKTTTLIPNDEDGECYTLEVVLT